MITAVTEAETVPRRPRPSIDGLGLALASWQAAMLAFASWYNAAGGFGRPSEVDFASGPACSRLALAYWSAGSGLLWLLATVVAFTGVARLGRLSYAPYIGVCLAEFTLTAGSYAVLAPWTTYVHSGPQSLSITPVCVDRDWPTFGFAAFLFCHPVLILILVRATLRTDAARAYPPLGR